MAGEHFPMECSVCGSRTWRLYKGENSISAKCSCGRQILIEAGPRERIEFNGVGQQHEHGFFTQLETDEKDVKLANIPRFVDPETMLTDPKNVVKI